MNAYQDLARRLHELKIVCYMQRDDMMVVARELPYYPTSNCFWVTHKNEDWFISTFAPRMYTVPRDVDIFQVCKECMESSVKAIARIDVEIVERYGLKLLSSEEYQRVCKS